ncbi:hypothetical protein LY76DRAFT_617843 [Colletotrichum caudatum]|nr:hypothetical protein LY76DRAFT_617843 [Colletotrichum caudatum]
MVFGSPLTCLVAVAHIAAAATYIVPSKVIARQSLCLSNLEALTGADRASYDASTPAYVVCSVANAADALLTLSGKNNIGTSTAAVKVAVQQLTNLYTIGRKSIIQAETPTGNTAREYFQTYLHHKYPGGTTTSLMLAVQHQLLANTARFDANIASVLAVKKPYRGYAANVSPSFGAARWVMEYSIRLAISGFSSIHFDHGIIGNNPCSLFGLALNDGKSAFAAYATLGTAGAPLCSEAFGLHGLTAKHFRSKLVTVANAETRKSHGGKA